MKRDTKILIGVLAVVALCAYALTLQNNSNAHQMVEELDLPADAFDGVTSLSELDENERFMYDHCKTMQEMQGCEPYNGLAKRLERGSNPGATFLPGQIRAATTTAKSNTIVDLADGDTYTLTAEVITKEIDGQELTMYGYNGMIPGPALRVQQGSTITVQFENNIELPTTVHWHGLRHDIANDGVPGVSQDPTQPGESFEYEVYFPDDGIFWYHPHVREDIQQDAGLAGNMLVLPTDTYNPVNQEELLVLDDVLLDREGIEPFGGDHANYAMMGRFGNTMLVNGETDYSLTVAQGSVVRFYITNVANVRPFKLSIPGATIKQVGSDLGQYETETFVDEVIIAPAERYIIDVYFEESGTYELLHTTPHETYTLGIITVTEQEAAESYTDEFLNDLENPTVQADIAQFEQYFDKPADYELDLTIDMGDFMGAMATMPCHVMGGMVMGDCTPEERAAMREDNHAQQDGIEWEDEMNMRAPAHQIEWRIEDSATGKANMDFMMNSEVGDVVKIRLVNKPDSMHPMQHPIHLHGQRFVVTHIDGVATTNKVWKDTVLVPIGSTVDILADVTNPGEWMMHCHIAEHLEAGMMTGFMVSG